VSLPPSLFDAVRVDYSLRQNSYCSEQQSPRRAGPPARASTCS